MKKRWLWMTLGAVALLLLLALILLPRFLDPESYRDQIELALRDATGWDAQLGEIDLSIWGGLALAVSPAGLSAPGDGSRLEIERIDVKASLFPLLRGELNIRRIDLIRPQIVLVRHALDEGWELPRVFSTSTDETDAGDLPGPGSATAGAEAPDAPTPADEKSSPIAVSIEQIRIRDGSLSLDDRAGEPPLTASIEDLDLDLSPANGSLSGGGRLPDGGELTWRGSVNEVITLGLDEVPTDLFTPLVGEELLHRGGSISGEIEADLPSRISGRLEGTAIRLLDGERPFDRVDAEFDLAGHSGGWNLDRFQLDADGARIVGAGSLLPDLALALQLTPTPLEAALRVSESVLPLPLDVEPPGSVQADLRVDRPEGGELTYQGSGELSAARLKPAEMLPDATDVRAAFELSPQGEMRIEILDGTVGEGPLRGVARIDSIVPPGKLSFEGGLQQAVLGQLLGGLVHDATERVTGPTGLDAQLTLDLSRAEIDARALGGRLEIDSQNVGMPGWDLEGALRRGIEEQAGSISGVSGLLDQYLGGDDDKEPEPDAAGEVVQAAAALLDRLGASVNFDPYPWALERMEIDAGEVSATGHGSFDPIEGTIDLDLTALMSAERTAELVGKTRELRALVGDDGRLAVPLRLRGPLLGPSLQIDLSGVLSDQLGEEKEKAVKGLLEGLLDRKKK